jgi:NDP-sugar pyrophosphorylase family protein
LSFRRQTDEEIEKEMPCFSGAFVLTKDFFDYEPVYVEGEAGIPHTLFGSGEIVYFVILNEWFQINTFKDLNFAKENLIN